MAAKRKKKSGLSPWIVAGVAVLITAIAVISLLSDQRLSVSSSSRENPVEANEDIPVDRPYDHDRDQIDQKSRDKLRDILRAEADSQ